MDDLGSEILRSAAETVQLVALDVLLGETEVGDLDVSIGIEEEILRLEVAVDDSFAVQVVETHRDLRGVETSTVFGETAIGEVEEELASVEEIRNEIELGLGLKREAQAREYKEFRNTRLRTDVHILP